MTLRHWITVLAGLLWLSGCAAAPATQPATATLPAFGAAGGFGLAKPPAPLDEDLVVYHLQYEDPSEIASMLHDILGVNAQALSKTRCVVVTGAKEPVRLAKGVLDTMDRSPYPEDIFTFCYPLENAPAMQVAALLGAIFSRGDFVIGHGNRATQSLAVADPRTNSLLIHTEEQYLEALKSLLQKLDAPTGPAAPATQAGER